MPTISFPVEVWDCVFLFFHPYCATETVVLSTRRNKGCLLTDKKKLICRTVNLSFLNSGSNDGFSSAVLRECAVLGGPLKNHPNIVPLLSVEFSLTEIRMTFPWHDRTLRDELLSENKSSVLSLSCVCDLTHQLFRALAFLHQNHVVHRNVRPENILFNRGTLVLTDFASAKFGQQPLSPCEARNRMQTVKERARLAYRSPESLLRLATCGTPTDVWAAGVVVAECLAARLPWAGASSETELLLKLWAHTGSDISAEDSLAFHFLLPAAKPTADTEWMEHTVGGPAATLLLRRLLDMNPVTRMSAAEALVSPFVLDTEDEVVAPEETCSVHGSLAKNEPPALGPEWVIWMLQIAIIGLEAPTSLCVHKALRIAGHSSSPSLLLAALKLSLRLETSRDAFKQAQCADLFALTGVEHIVEAEVELLRNADFLTQWTTVNTSIEIVQQEAKSVRKLASYICDLCLIDRLAQEQFSPTVIGIAAIILASQWINCEPANVHRSLRCVSLDDVQLALTRCVLLVRTANLPTTLYNLPPLPPNSWQTSRSYLTALRPEQTPDRRRAATPNTVMCTPLFRTSTLQQASAWALASRRRSRSAKRRHSSGPPAEDIRVGNSENENPNVRRSVRLKNLPQNNPC